MVERISPPRFARDPLLFLGTVYNRRIPSNFLSPFPSSSAKSSKAIIQGKRRERGARKTLACPAKAREFPGLRRSRAPLPFMLFIHPRNYGGARARREGRGARMKVVLLKGEREEGGEKRKREQRSFSPRKRAVDYSSEKSIVSIVRFQIAAMRACVRACVRNALFLAAR